MGTHPLLKAKLVSILETHEHKENRCNWLLEVRLCKDPGEQRWGFGCREWQAKIAIISVSASVCVSGGGGWQSQRALFWAGIGALWSPENRELHLKHSLNKSGQIALWGRKPADCLSIKSTLSFAKINWFLLGKNGNETHILPNISHDVYSPEEKTGWGFILKLNRCFHRFLHNSMYFSKQNIKLSC